MPENTTSNTTPDPNRPGYDFRGAKLTLDTVLPGSPAEANVYTLFATEPASVEYAQNLANQFGITGDVYTVEQQYSQQTGFMITDGKQRLEVFGLNHYSYTADMVTSSRTYNGFENGNAETTIREFLTSHGLDFSYSVEQDDLLGGYSLNQISPDGLSMQFESLSQRSMHITLDENGNVLTVVATMLNFDPAPVGTYGIVSAEEALQRLLDDSLPAGKIETGSSGPNPDYIPPQYWYREYPDNQTITLYGNISSSQPVDPSKPAIVFIDNVSVTGNTAGMEALEFYTPVEATGQFVLDGAIRKFNVETWKKSTALLYGSGSVKREGDQFILNSPDGQYPILDAPTDLPLNTDPTISQIAIEGALVNGKLDWRRITFIPDINQMGGGGGGGGISFYPLNLSGTPIPFPTATSVSEGYSPAELAGFLTHKVQEGDTLGQIAATYNVSVDEIVDVNYLSDTSIFVGQYLVIPGVPGPTRLDGERGTVMVNIYEKPDGRRRTEYTFAAEKDQAYYELKGENLEPLQEVDNMPITIWGAIHFDENGLPSLTVEKFEVLYPDLQYQVLRGTQKMTQVNGEDLVLFTSEGTTYVQMVSTGGYPDSNYFPENTETLIEGLLIPEEVYAGYPVIRMFNIGPAIDPTTGKAMELPLTADRIEVLPDPYGNADNYTQPDMVIDSVELIYYVNSPYLLDAPQGETYIQPAWHFHGHYTNGSIVDILVQALQQEYLSPNIEQSIP
ncbi:MAG: LysM peptidoglycan-binding domain-containing protein [Anaerolineales bacterium]